MDVADFIYNMEEDAFEELKQLVKMTSKQDKGELAQRLRYIKIILEKLK